MEPPKGVWASCCSFLYFLPFFLGLLFLGIIKGIIFTPVVCLIIAIGNSAVAVGLWPMHLLWSCYCIVRAKQLGPILKFLLCVIIPVILVIWPIISITVSILGGAAYGFLSPLMATFDAVGEGKRNMFTHCFVDGTWSTIIGSFTVVRDFTDVCFHSYFSVMDEFRSQEPQNGYPYDIRLCHLLGAILVGLLGILVDVPMVSLIALFKSPFMLFKGWHRLMHDLIGREGPFLEAACVPFAGLAILLWPLAVLGAVLASCLSSFFLGAYAAVVVYQESSCRFGFNYIISSLAIFDEYSNDIIDMPEGSCFPRYPYGKDESSSRTSSFSKPNSFNKGRMEGKNPPSRSISFKNAVAELKLVELYNILFAECKQKGEAFVYEGLITEKDIENYRFSKGGSRILSIGLPAYCILETLLRSAKENSDGLLLGDNTEITVENRPRDTIFGLFFNPFLIMKQQIKAENLSEEEERYLQDLVLLNGDPERLERWSTASPPTSERRRAEVDALARRLQGMVRTISRYPTIRRQTENLVFQLADEIAKRTGSQSKILKSKSNLKQIVTFRSRTGSQAYDQETQLDKENGEDHVWIDIL